MRVVINLLILMVRNLEILMVRNLVIFIAWASESGKKSSNSNGEKSSNIDGEKSSNIRSLGHCLSFLFLLDDRYCIPGTYIALLCGREYGNRLDSGMNIKRGLLYYRRKWY